MSVTGQVVFPLAPEPASIYVGGYRYPSSIIVERTDISSDDFEGKLKILQQTCQNLSEQLIELKAKVEKKQPESYCSSSQTEIGQEISMSSPAPQSGSAPPVDDEEKNWTDERDLDAREITRLKAYLPVVFDTLFNVFLSNKWQGLSKNTYGMVPIDHLQYFLFELLIDLRFYPGFFIRAMLLSGSVFKGQSFPQTVDVLFISFVGVVFSCSMQFCLAWFLWTRLPPIHPQTSNYNVMAGTEGLRGSFTGFPYVNAAPLPAYEFPPYDFANDVCRTQVLVQLICVGLFLFYIFNNVPGIVKNTLIIIFSSRFISQDEDGIKKLHYWRESGVSKQLFSTEVIVKMSSGRQDTETQKQGDTDTEKKRDSGLEKKRDSGLESFLDGAIHNQYFLPLRKFCSADDMTKIFGPVIDKIKDVKAAKEKLLQIGPQEQNFTSTTIYNIIFPLLTRDYLEIVESRNFLVSKMLDIDPDFFTPVSRNGFNETQKSRTQIEPPRSDFDGDRSKKEEIKRQLVQVDYLRPSWLRIFDYAEWKVEQGFFDSTKPGQHKPEQYVSPGQHKQGQYKQEQYVSILRDRERRAKWQAEALQTAWWRALKLITAHLVIRSPIPFRSQLANLLLAPASIHQLRKYDEEAKLIDFTLKDLLSETDSQSSSSKQKEETNSKKDEDSQNFWFSEILSFFRATYAGGGRMIIFRVLAFVFGVLPEVLVMIMVLIAGVQYVLWSGTKVESNTQGMEEIILATLAIAFIFDIDESIYDHVFPQRFKEAHELDKFEIMNWISANNSLKLEQMFTIEFAAKVWYFNMHYFSWWTVTSFNYGVVTPLIKCFGFNDERSKRGFECCNWEKPVIDMREDKDDSSAASSSKMESSPETDGKDVLPPNQRKKLIQEDWNALRARKADSCKYMDNEDQTFENGTAPSTSVKTETKPTLNTSFFKTTSINVGQFLLMSAKSPDHDLKIALQYPFLYARKYAFFFSSHSFEAFLFWYGKGFHFVMLLSLVLAIVGGYRNQAQCQRYSYGSSFSVWGTQPWPDTCVFQFGNLSADSIGEMYNKDFSPAGVQKLVPGPCGPSGYLPSKKEWTKLKQGEWKLAETSSSDSN